MRSRLRVRKRLESDHTLRSVLFEWLGAAAKSMIIVQVRHSDGINAHRGVHRSVRAVDRVIFGDFRFGIHASLRE